MDTAMIEVSEISRVYEKLTALDKITFTVGRNELFGLIGPDGAGKTSLFRILTSLLLPSSGSARVDSLDVVGDYKRIRTIIGYMPGRFSLYQDLSVEENINFFATLFGTTLKENYSLVEPIYSQLEPFRKRPAGKLSGGMKQKLALSCALIHRPKVLFLDEPTTGVDPVSRMEFWEMLGYLKGLGITIMVSTPYMDEAVLCDRIALIDDGHLLKVQTPAQIIDEYDLNLFAVRGEPLPKILRLLRSSDGIISCFSFGDQLHVALNDNDPHVIEEALVKGGFTGCNVQKIEASIEDCYMHLTGK